MYTHTHTHHTHTPHTHTTHTHTHTPHTHTQKNGKFYKFYTGLLLKVSAQERFSQWLFLVIVVDLPRYRYRVLLSAETIYSIGRDVRKASLGSISSKSYLGLSLEA